MHRHNDDTTDDLLYPPVASGLPRRPGLRFNAPPAAAGNWGFVVPVLVVFSALWFLLSDTRAF